MSSTFSNLKFELIGNGEQSGQWGTTTNANIGTAIEQAIVGMATLDSGDFTANVCTLSLTNTTAAQDARALCLNIASGAVSAAGTINVPAIQKPYIVINGSSFAVTVKVSGQTGVAVPPGTRTVVYNNGTDVGNQISFLSSLTLLAPLPIASGGTGTSSTTFVNLATNVTGTLPVANGGTGVTTSTGSGSNVLSTSPTLVTPILGTPTSVTLTNATGLPLTTGVTGTLPIANGGTGTTSTTFVNLATNVTGTLPIANGGSGATTAAAARTNFGATTLGSNLFTISNPSAVTFPRFNADNTVSALDAAAFRTAIGAGSGGGTVTSVGGTGTVNGITLTGTVTSTGNLTLGGTLSGVNLTSQVTGTLPVANGGTGVTTSTGSGANVLATSPTLVTPILGTPTSATLTNATGLPLTTGVTGTLPVANGGTGATTLTGLTIPQAVLAQPVITQNVQVIGTNTTAVASRIYVLTASLTLTLPASPSAGNTVTVSNMSGVLTATIARNSQPIMALAEDLTVDLDGAGFTLVYADSTRGWVLLP